MLFNYASGIPENFIRKGGYLPGTIAKTGWKEVESFNSNSVLDPIEFGSVVKRVVNNGLQFVETIEEDDTNEKFLGIAVNDVTSQSLIDLNYGNPNVVKQYFSGSAISVMVEGYVCVPVQQGTPKVGAPVYVRIMPSLTNPSLPLGGIEALADVGNVEWKNVIFESDGFYPFKGTTNSPTETTATSQCAIIRVEISKYGMVPTITSAPNDVITTYGTLPRTIELVGGSAEYNGEEVEGRFVMNNPDYLYSAGTHNTTCTFIPNDSMFEKVTNIEISITVNKATPTVLTMPVPSGNLYYGDGLFELALVGGVANTPGTFEWDEENTRPQEDGEQAVIFYPLDTDNYNDLNNLQVNVTVVKVPLEMQEQPTTTEIQSGETLNDSAIEGGIVTDFRDEELEIDGEWAWNNPAEVVNATGSYAATFTPTNLDKYETLTVLLPVTVNV